MTIGDHLLEMREHLEEGYRPVIDYASWRVAILNYSDALLPENLKAMQRHNETDEVFVLLRGRCILFIGEGADAVHALYAENMKPLKVYNVKKKVWHTHTLSRDGVVLIVENKDTTYDNSPFVALTKAQQKNILKLAQTLWAQSGGS